MYQLTGSIVLYKTDNLVEKAIESFLNSSLKIKLYLIDNSPTDKLRQELKTFLKDKRVEYIFNDKNIGFGAGHNVALKKAVDISDYHLVFNPDTYFEKNVLEELCGFLQKNENVGHVQPQVLNYDGSLQRLCKLLPTPLNSLGRRFFPNSNWSKKLDDKYQLKNFDYNHCINLPNLSGCFMLLRSAVLKKTGIFDERYFMYYEDVDLTRRMHRVSETLFYPYVNIYHGYEKASYSNFAVLKYHVNSAVKYFNKWGWFFDEERSRFNQKVLQNLTIKSF